MREIVYNKLMINENYANMNLLDSVQENVEGIHFLKSFVCEKYEQEKFE